MQIMFKMTPNILRNLLVKKSTRRYPHEVRNPFEDTRGELINDMDACNLCGVCNVKCPSQCITVDKKAGLWICDPFSCVYCGVCVDACPAHSLSQRQTYRSPVTEPVVISMKGQPKKPVRPKPPEPPPDALPEASG
jgi:ech hydrogenase subunit F